MTPTEQAAPFLRSVDRAITAAGRLAADLDDILTGLTTAARHAQDLARC